jgi:hypothetical protein
MMNCIMTFYSPMIQRDSGQARKADWLSSQRNASSDDLAASEESAPRGHAAAPPSNVMKSRRFTRSLIG